MRTQLTVKRINAIDKPGRYGDGNTLFLVVAPGGSKSWVQRLTIHGRRHDIGLGGYPLATLAEARDMALDNRRLARKGGDPLAEKRRAKVPNFREAALATFEANKPRWRNAKVTKNWWQQMELHALPKLGPLAVNAVGREDVLRVLTPIWTDRPEAARRVRRSIRQTLDWAMAHGHVETNVAADAVRGALPTMPSVKHHYRALPYQELGAALGIIGASRASDSAKGCLTFIACTAARSGEARGATWDEIDLERRLWTIPAARMKSANEHRVPLSDPAIAVLERVRPLSGGDGLVFPSPQRPGKPMSDMTLTKVLRVTDLAARTTVHGLRSSFRDWCADTNKPREIAEAALAHVVSGVEGAYFRSDLIERRRGVMEAWAQYITGETGTVVQLHA